VEALSTFDIFKIGIGPSSSHTMGPWRAAQLFLDDCRKTDLLDCLTTIRCDLYGSLAKTGKGHGTDLAVVLGLLGEDPVTCNTGNVHNLFQSVTDSKHIKLAGTKEIGFDPRRDIVFHFDKALPFHPNGLSFTATTDDGGQHEQTYYSVGGGFVVQEESSSQQANELKLPYQVETAADLLRHCREQSWTIPQVVRANELALRSEAHVHQALAGIWQTMQECIFRGCTTGGILPGGLGVVRRAAKLNAQALGERKFASLPEWLTAVREHRGDFHDVLKWVSCFALAVNEENAAFGRVVTAPTNGAAGVVPAVLLYHDCFNQPKRRPNGAAPTGAGSDWAQHEEFLLTAAVIGMLFKNRATLSAAMGGCQAEIGVSSAMAAAGLCQVLGGSPEQVLMAAEIAMEHHLGLTCDPVAGLVQIPCIERNTMGAVKAITACNLALAGDPAAAKVSLDAVINTMWATAQDMNAKYKETSEGGLAMQIPVNVSEC
jgi:L-serine dehydratase